MKKGDNMNPFGKEICRIAREEYPEARSTYRWGKAISIVGWVLFAVIHIVWITLIATETISEILAADFVFKWTLISVILLFGFQGYSRHLMVKSVMAEDIRICTLLEIHKSTSLNNTSYETSSRPQHSPKSRAEEVPVDEDPPTIIRSNENNWWICPQCQASNLSREKNCLVCGAPREVAEILSNRKNISDNAPKTAVRTKYGFIKPTNKQKNGLCEICIKQNNLILYEITDDLGRRKTYMCQECFNKYINDK